MKEIFNEFKTLNEQAMKPLELKSTQRSILRNFNVARLDDFDTFLIQTVRFGLPVNFYREQIAQTGKLTEDEIFKFAARALKPDKLVWVVVGDRQAIEPALRASGLGEVRIIEPKDIK